MEINKLRRKAILKAQSLGHSIFWTPVFRAPDSPSGQHGKCRNCGREIVISSMDTKTPIIGPASISACVPKNECLESFIAWAKVRMLKIRQNKDGGFSHMLTRIRWDAWQAAWKTAHCD